MSKIYRYFDVLLRSRFGLSLPWNAVGNYLKYYLKQPEDIMKPSGLAPVIMHLFTTEKCNLNCSFCSNRHVRNRQDRKNAEGEKIIMPEMDTNFVERVLSRDLVKRTLAVVLSGGEPLLNRDIIAIIQTVKKHKKQCGMITNGIFLPDRLEELAAARLDEIQLSVYDHTLERLEKILPSICKKFPINASYVLLRSVMENKPWQVEKIIRFCREAGCKSMKINLCLQSGDDAGENIYDDCEAYSAFVAGAQKRDKGFRVYYPEPARRIIRGCRDKRCLIPWQAIYVNALGQFAMCCDYLQFEGMKNDLFDDNEHKSYNSPSLVELRNYLLSEDVNPGVRCNSCVNLSGAFASRL